MQRPVRMEMGCQSLALIMKPPVLHSTAARTRNRIALRRSVAASISGSSDPGRIQDRNQPRPTAARSCDLRVQLDPVEPAMLRVRIDAHHRAVKPALALPETRIQEDTHTFSDLDTIRHTLPPASDAHQ